MLVFERHGGCLLAVRFETGPTCSYCYAWRQRFEVAFSGGKITLRGDAGFAVLFLYEFTEFFVIEYALGILLRLQSSQEPR